MSVGSELGFGGPYSPSLETARAAFDRWRRDDPVAGVPQRLDELPRWTMSARQAEKDVVLAALARDASSEPDLVLAVAWLLLPGARALARDLQDIHPDIDGLVAGQLCIEILQAADLDRFVAATILRRVRSAVLGELGVGDPGRRRDRVWATACLDPSLVDRLAASPAADEEPEPADELGALLVAANRDDVIVGFDRWLLQGLAAEAARKDALAHRGRMGLTSPSVVEAFAFDVCLAPRTLRARASKALDRLAAWTAVRESPARYAVWKAQNRRPELTPREIQELLCVEEETHDFIQHGIGPSEALYEQFWDHRYRRFGPAAG